MAIRTPPRDEPQNDLSAIRALGVVLLRARRNTTPVRFFSYLEMKAKNFRVQFHCKEKKKQTFPKSERMPEYAKKKHVQREKQTYILREVGRILWAQISKFRLFWLRGQMARQKLKTKFQEKTEKFTPEIGANKGK